MEKETGRIEAFSDGVFAIAVTLLVLDIHVPKNAGSGLGEALREQWPTYLAYAVSFLTILIMWINHHRVFQHIRRTDHGLLMLNGLLLMSVTVIPFPTSLLAEYARHSGEHVAAAVFSGTYLVMAVLFNLLWRYASRDGRLLDEQADRTDVEAIARQYRFGPLLYLVIFVLAFVSVPACVGLSLLLTLFFALPPRAAA